MTTSALEWVFLRQQFYYRGYRLLVAFILLLLILIASLLGFIYYQSFTVATSHYFPALPDGRWLETPTLDQAAIVWNGNLVTDPKQIESLVKEWSERATLKAYTMDFVNWRSSIQDLRENFTAHGHAEFLKALEASNNLQTVKIKKHVVTAKTRGETRIVHQGPMQVSSGWFNKTQRYRWDIQIPIQLLYQNSTGDTLEQNILSSMVILRVPTLEGNTGIAIAQLVFEDDIRTP